MGNTQHKTGAAAHEQSLLDIEDQAASLEERVRTHRAAAANQMVHAQRARNAGNTQGAVALMRQRAQTIAQIDTIEGIIGQLSSHRHALETKLMMGQTMRVMARTAKTLSTNTHTVGHVDDMIIHAGELQDDARALGLAMASTDDTGNTDEDYLALLDQPAPPAEQLGVAVPPAMQTEATPDEQLVLFLEAELLSLELPPVPSKQIGATRAISPPPPVYENTLVI
jgi:hypothetical protein